MDGKKREISETVGARIRQLRKSQGLSQEELALRSELSPAYYGLVERGAKCPSVETIWKIAAGLGVSPSELLRTEAVPEDYRGYVERAGELLSKVPPHKLEQVLRLIENLVDMI